MRCWRTGGATALVMMLLAGCGGGAGEKPQLQAAEAAAYAVTLRLGETVTLAGEGLSLKLDTVEDSRCPAQVQCVWAGQGVVGVTVAQGSEAPTSLHLGLAGGPVPASAAYRAFRITLQALEPAPVAAQPTPAEAWRASLRIERS